MVSGGTKHEAETVPRETVEGKRTRLPKDQEIASGQAQPLCPYG